MYVHRKCRPKYASCWQCSEEKELSADIPTSDHAHTYHSEVPRAILSPVAHGVQNRTPGSIKRARHVVVTLKGYLRGSRTTFIVAVIVLEIVNTPRRVRLGIDLFEVERSKLATAGVPEVEPCSSLRTLRLALELRLTFQRCCIFQAEECSVGPLTATYRNARTLRPMS